MSLGEPPDWGLLYQALGGNELATKMYCGAYTLVMDGNGLLYRCKDVMPEGYFIPKMKTPVYDKDGFLLSQYWSLPRI